MRCIHYADRRSVSVGGEGIGIGIGRGGGGVRRRRRECGKSSPSRGGDDGTAMVLRAGLVVGIVVVGIVVVVVVVVVDAGLLLLLLGGERGGAEKPGVSTVARGFGARLLFVQSLPASRARFLHDDGDDG